MESSSQNFCCYEAGVNRRRPFDKTRQSSVRHLTSLAISFVVLFRIRRLRFAQCLAVKERSIFKVGLQSASADITITSGHLIVHEMCERKRTHVRLRGEMRRWGGSPKSSYILQDSLLTGGRWVTMLLVPLMAGLSGTETTIRCSSSLHCSPAHRGEMVGLAVLYY